VLNSTAFSLSGLAGAQSNGSSVRLKSPIMKSINPNLCRFHCVCTMFQKDWCSAWLFSAYMFSMFIIFSLCHFNINVMALPGINTIILALETFSFSLLIMKATLAKFPGQLVSEEFSTSSLLENRVSICFSCLFVRWVSCTHSIPILSSFANLLIIGYFEIGLRPRDGEALPFIFNIARMMFVWVHFFLLVYVCC